MRSIELSERVKATVEEAQSRIMGVGREQYEDEDTKQRFESYTLTEMLTGMREEVIDTINYCVMMDELLQRRLAQLAEKGE
jgi:hypothetical protein